MDELAWIHTNRQTAPPRGTVQTVVAGHLITEPDAQNLCSVSVNRSEPIPGVPAIPGVYAGVTVVRVLMQGGRPVLCLGPAGSIPVGPLGPGTISPPPPSTAGQTQTVTRTITPTATGTYRVSYGRWGETNHEVWGNAADVYQGSPSTAGQLWGLATYGNSITSAGFVSITSGTLTLAQATHTGLSGAWTATVQGSSSVPSGGAPSFSGATFTIGMPGRSVSGTRSATIPGALLEELRTGAKRSLGLAGSPYGITLGLGRHGQAWVLSLTGEVPQ